jgi:pimeloyl-ACP methyl ester carboxylesterase
VERVEFENSRGLKLVGDYLEADSDAGIVMAHGFTGDRTEWGYFNHVAEYLNDSGYNVLRFDFSGSGESDNEPIAIGNQVEDLKSAIEYIESRGVERLGLYGHSQGGLVSLRNHDLADVLVLTSPVTNSLANYGEKKLTESQREELERKGKWTVTREKGPRNEYVIDGSIIEEKESINQNELLEEIEEPVKIIHGDQDEVVPLEHSKDAVDMLETSELKVVEGLNHGYNEKIGQIAEEAEKWFQKHMPI